MNARVTLSMDKQLIDSAKEYSARTGKSLSRLVADFFELIRQGASGAGISAAANCPIVERRFERQRRGDG